MKIYIAHSRDYDYENELYLPLKNSELFKQHEFVLPHDGDNFKHDREYYRDFDLVIAEVSYPSTGLGIELGFAFDDDTKICCVHKAGATISSSISAVTSDIYEYLDADGLIRAIEEIVKASALAR